MRKFYSLVLTALFLLVGTNVWAATRTAGSATEFKTQWSAAASGDVIKLTGDITANGGLDATLWLGTANMNDAKKSITIDLNGHDLASKAARMFLVTHGELKIITSVINEGHNKVIHTGSSETFYLTGSTKKDVDPSVDGSDYFTHLVIGENVTVERPQLTTTKTKPNPADEPYVNDNAKYLNDYEAYVSDKYRNYKCAAIAIDNVYSGSYPQLSDANSVPSKSALNYYTNVYGNSAAEPNKGVANGVRIDIYGTVNGLRYGVKPNGYLGNVAWFVSNKARRNGVALPVEGADPMYAHNGKLGTNYKIQDGDDSYSAFIHIYPTGKVTALSETPEELVNDMKPSSGETSRAKWGTPTALYGGGYARWIVEGTAKGASGAIIKSGNVVLNNATIEGTGTYISATHTTSSNTGEGSGLLVVSDDSWAGSVSVTTNGTTEVSSDKGYAVEEVVPAVTDGSKVDAITVNGGKFEGGDEGAISISQTTADTTATVLIVSATITGQVEYGGTGHLTDIIPASKDSVAIAYNDQTAEYTVIVTKVDATVAIDPVSFDIDTVTNGRNYNLSTLVGIYANQAFDADGRTTMTLGTLTINPQKQDPTDEFEIVNNVTLTITAGHTIVADKVILGEKGKIIVEPGATLIIKGEEGITSTTAEHIVLKANNSAQAIFLLNPAVINNSEPNAKVELYTIGKQTAEDPWYYKFQEFALPVKEGVRPDNNYDNQTLFGTETQFTTYVRALDYAQNNWDYISSWSQLQPFTNYQIANNTVDGGITYTFEGKLLGNKNRYCQFNGQGFGYFGNSHLAPISIQKLMEDFGEDVQKTVWVYNYDKHGYDFATPGTDIFGKQPTEVKSMQAFILYLNEGTSTTAPINYANAVWGNPRFAGLTAAPAPARQRANALNNGALINVVAANGMEDYVILMEDNAYSENFDNGADASKLMNEEGINLYVATANGNQSVVADNSIENTRMTFKAGEATEYTLKLGKVFGEDYAIRDNVTGTIFNCAEGVEYSFYQAENTVAEGRFEVIAVAKTATGIENAEDLKTVKGIYSITGMYLGEDLNVLPAGVYVVNGVKVVK